MRRRSRPARSLLGRRLLLLAALLLVLAAGLGLHAHLAFRPEQVRELLVASVSEILAGEVTLSPIVTVGGDREVTFRDLVVASPSGGGGGEILRVRRVVIRPRALPLLFGALVVDEALLVEPVLRVTPGETGPGALAGILGPRARQWLLPGAAAPSAGDDTPVTAERLPRIRIEGGAAHLEVASPDGEPTRQDFLDVNARMKPGDPDEVQLELSCRLPFLDRLEIHGRWKVPDRAGTLEVRARRVDLAGQLQDLVPDGLRYMARRSGLRGLADLEGRVRLESGRGIVVESLGGQLSDGHLQLPDAPYPCERISGHVSVVGRELGLSGAEGRFGAGSLSGDVVMRWSSDWSRIESLRGAARLPNVPLTSRLGDWIPAALRPQFDRLELGGRIGIACEVDADELPPQPDDVSVEITLHDVDLRHRDFSYPFEDLAGTVSVENGQATVTTPLRARRGDSHLTVTGWIDITRPERVQIDATVQGLVLDDTLQNAIPASGLAHWRQFRPRGVVDLGLDLRGTNEAGSSSPRRRITVTARGVTIQPQGFPCEIRDITGQAVVDLASGRVDLGDLRGEREGEAVVATGTVELSNPLRWNLEVAADRLEIDDDLVALLPVDIRRFVDETGLRGTVGVVAGFRSAGDGTVSRSVTVDVGAVRARYAAFPVPLEFHGGRIEIPGDGVFLLRDLRTAPGFRPGGNLRGEFRRTGAERVFDFEMEIDDLVLDERLRGLLPEDLRRLAAQLRLAGTFSGRLAGSMRYDVDDLQRRTVSYHARGVRTGNASIDFGLAMRDIRASGDFDGQSGLDGRHRLSGTVQVESSRFNRLRFRDVELAFVFGQPHPAIAKLPAERPRSGGGFVPDALFAHRLQPDRVGDTIQVQVLDGTLYGGALDGVLYVDAGERRDFAGEFMVRHASVPDAARDVFKTESDRIEGECGGRVLFRGTTGDAGSVQGGGTVSVRDASLVDLPLFVGFMSLLFSLKPTTQPRFREADLTFSIADGRFTAAGPSGIAIRGDGVNLLGYGSLDFGGRLNVTLTPHLTDLRIPVVETLLDFVKKTLLQIWVEGDLEEPSFRLVTGAGLVRVPFGAGDSSRRNDGKSVGEHDGEGGRTRETRPRRDP